MGIFAYNNQFNVPQLTGELTPAPEVRRMARVSWISTGLSFLLYTSISAFGVLAFGVREGQRDSLVLDLDPYRRNPLVFSTLLAVMFSVLTCFQFHVYPIRQFAAFSVRKARGRSSEDEKADVVYHGLTIARWFDIASAIVTVVIVILIAVVITSLRTILDFMGACAAAYTSFVVPPLWIIQVRRRQQTFTWMSLDVLGCLAFFLLACFCLSSGLIPPL